MAVFQNQAALLTDNGTVLSNIVYGEVNNSLSITKTALSGSYEEGGGVTYIISITNTSSSPVTGLTLEDDLGSYAFGTFQLTPLDFTTGAIRLYVNGALQPAPSVTAGPPLTVTGLSIPAGGNAVLIYETQTNSFAPIDTEGSITNTATLSGSGANLPITADETVFAAAAPMLTITKQIDSSNISTGDAITYTFIILNSGNTGAGTEANLQISDTFDPSLDITSVTVNGAPFTNYTYTGSSFLTEAGAITVPAATITQDPTTGAWTVTPGETVVTVTGTVL